MRKGISLIAVLLVSAFASLGQQADWKPRVYSEEFHFLANFPADPKESTGDLELSFGKSSARRWTLELPNISYEILVADFPNLSVKPDHKSLRRFYESVCVELGGSTRDCSGGYGDERFGDIGRSGGFRSANTDVEYFVCLVGKRLYIAKILYPSSMGKEFRDAREKFLDKFLFGHLNEKNEFIWGL